MTGIVSTPATPFGADNYVWIGICRPRANQLHCGFIYRFGGEDRIVHLAFHYDLRDELYESDYWCAPVGLDRDNQAALAAILRSIVNGNPSVPYGFDISGIAFDEATGEFSQPVPGTGLTCATFILAVLKTHRFVPLQVESWPLRDDDAAWQKSMIETMRQYRVPDEHVAAVTARPEAARFRPEEVTGCVATDSEKWAIAFDDARDLAARVLADIAAA